MSAFSGLPGGMGGLGVAGGLNPGKVLVIIDVIKSLDD